MPLIPQQKLAARKLGVSATALRQWQGEPGFPHNAGGYDLDAIRAWLAAKGSPKADADADDNGTIAGRMNKAKLARAIANAKRDQVRAEREQRDNEIAKGNILARDELTLTLRELITQARTRLTNDLPRELAKRFPKLRAKVLTVAEETVRKILDDFARDLAQLEIDNTQQTGGQKD
jgi:hypothetical protein